MSVSKFMAAQYAKPTGWFGRLVMDRLLNSSNAQGNQLVFETLGLTPNDRVLEVGFGGGELLLHIARSVHGGRIEGVELSDTMRQNLESRMSGLGLSNVGLYHGTVESLPFEDATFNAACSVNTIYFWPSLENGLKELARVIREDGTLVLGFGGAEHLRHAGYGQRGFKLYDSSDIKKALVNNGFRVDALNSIDRGKRGPFYALRGICEQ